MLIIWMVLRMSDQLKSEQNKQDFFKIIHNISVSEEFFKSDGAITPHQLEAIEKYGGFLSLAPKENPALKNIDFDTKNHLWIALNLLDRIRDYNLSVNGDRFSSLELKTDQKREIKKDLAIAKKYLKTIKDSPSKELVSLVKQNIQDYQDMLTHKWMQDGIIMHKEFPTINPYKEEYQAYTKSYKTNIRKWLNKFVKNNNIQGYSKDIKKLIDNL